jgi:methyl-accepting chemotaxis protein
MTAVYLASGGEKLGRELNKQRAVSDKKQEKVDVYLATFDVSKVDKTWQSRLSDVQGELAKRAEIRARVDRLQITKNRALTYYTGANLKVLDLIKFTGQLSHNVSVSNAVSAFSFYLLAKDRVGIERAVGSSAFAVGKFSIADLRTFQNLISTQELYFKEFNDLAKDDQIKMLPEILLSPEAVAVQKMRDQAIIGGMLGDLGGFSGADFFNAQTRKIELLKLGENRLSADLLALVSATKGDVLRERNLLVVTSAVILLSIASLSILLTRTISSSVDSVVQTAEKMAEGELDADFPQMTKNEIGRITAALQKFRDSIREGRRQEERAQKKQQEMLKEQDRLEKEKLAAEKSMQEQAEQKERELRQEQARSEKEKQAVEQAMLHEQQEKQAAIRDKEQKAAAEIAVVVNNCGEGDFSHQLQTDDKDGVFAEICRGMNRIGKITGQNLEHVLAALSALKQGDIAYRMEGDFTGMFAQIQTDVNEAFESLSSVIYQIDSSSESIRASTSEISDSSASLAKRTEAAAANLEETASSVEELSKAVHRANELATETNSSIAGIENHTKKSTEIVEETIESILGIKEASNTISKTITVIDEIAFQTNLLALNAGVEAARAGEAGRGFAVVASEIRDLAAKSSDAAHEISALINTNEIRVAEGVKMVNQTGKALIQIDGDISQISRSVNEIAESASQQSNSIDEIRVATNQLDQVTQENAAMFEETTALSMSLKAETEALRNVMASFQIQNEEVAQHSEAPQALAQYAS